MIQAKLYPYLLILLIAFLAASGNSQTYQLYFESANNDYLEGNYEEALKKYNQILEYGLVSGEVYFNLGNTCYKLKQYGRSIYYYEVAKKYLPGDEALERNLQLAQIHTIDKIEPVPQLFLKTWWNSVINLFGMGVYAWATFFAFFVLITVLILRLLIQSRLNKTIWSFAIIFMMLLVIFSNKVYVFETTKFGIILSAQVSVVSEPNVTGAETFILHEGTKIEVLRSLGDWYEIRIADGKTGWTRNSDVNII